MLGADTTADQSTIKKIEAWRDKLFFLIDVGVPGMPALYTPSSQARDVGSPDDDRTKLLVPVIPDLTPVRISTRSLTVAPYDPDAPIWDRAFLREDILWIAHYNPTPHSGKAKTVELAMRQAWWPQIEAQAALVHKHCATCTESAEVERSIGTGIQSRKRFAWMVADDKLLSDSIKSIPGITYVSVLGMVDPASGNIRFRLRRSMSAIDAAIIIFCTWIAAFGVMVVLSSDNHGSFSAEVARLINRILGVEDRVFGAVYNSRSQAHIETRNRLISEALDAAAAKGDVTCDSDLELYVAEAEMKGNQIIVTDGSTTFERTTGEPARSIACTSAAPALTEEELTTAIENLNGFEQSTVTNIYDRCASLMHFKALQTDKRARYNRAHLLDKESRKQTVKYDLQDGELVSMGGRKVTLDSKEPPGSTDPTTAWVTDSNGKRLHVRYDSLKPLSVGMDEKIMPKVPSDALAIGMLTAYETEAGLTIGSVTALAADSVTVHEWMPSQCKTGITWAPMWHIPNRQDPQRYVARPKVCTGPSLVELYPQDVVCPVTLKGKKLDELSVARLRSLGYDLF